jgi:hypothetical protein
MFFYWLALGEFGSPNVIRPVRHVVTYFSTDTLERVILHNFNSLSLRRKSELLQLRAHKQASRQIVR